MCRHLCIYLFAACLLSSCAYLRPVRTTKYLEYPVQKGDTLCAIAQRFDVSVSELKTINRIYNPRNIQVGKVLKVPFFGQSRYSCSAHTRRNKRKTPKMPLRQAKDYVGYLQWPLERVKINSEFGWRRFNFHEGLDLKAPSGTPIYAAHNGLVVYSGAGLRAYGNIIVIKNDSLLTIYAHNRRNRVRKGQRVKKGQYIGDVGATGKVTGPHLHFETRIRNAEGNYAAVNPEAFFKTHG